MPIGPRRPLFYIGVLSTGFVLGAFLSELLREFLPPDAAATMLEEHRSFAAQVVEKTDIFKNIGNDRKGSGDANEALDAAVAKYREENPDVGEAKAMDAVMKLQPELYTAIRAEREE